MADSTIRIGMIGCGNNQSNRVKLKLADIPEVAVVALSDPTEQAVAAMKEKNPGLAETPVYADYREMLEKADLDAVMISSPHKFHCDQICDSLDAGLHVLTEKPMVCSVAEAKRCIAKRDETGKVLEVAYQRHFQPPFRYARHAVQSGALGDIYFATVYQSQRWWHPSRAGRWRYSKDLSGGGQLNDSGSHLVDILLWMTDLRPAEAFAYVDHRGTEVDVLTAASVKFANGALCNISIVGEAAYQQMVEGEHIWGTKGHIAIEGVGQPKITLREPMSDEDERMRERLVDPSEAPPCPPWPEQNFIEAIRGRAEVEVPAECGLRVIQLSEAIWESAELGRPVAVKE